MESFAPWLLLIVPVALWAVFSLLTRDWQRRRLFGLIAGADNRLSLSRLQAFAWTMVIFGAYASAMYVRQLNLDMNASAAARARYEDAVAAEELARAALARVTPDKVAEQQGKILTAAAGVREAKKGLEPFAWVRIPAELLILAGISIGTGVFASMIASSGGDGPPVVHNVTVFATAAVDPVSRNPRSATPRGKSWMLIEGTRLGSDGEVRLNARAARQLFWEADGTAVAVDLDDSRRYGTMIVDTRNGKVTYGLEYANRSSLPAALQLGRERHSYELADLVRDDTNPRNLSITKFQMFGWTLVAIVIYLVVFLKALAANPDGIPELPVVDATVVMLTGVSQLGYLGGKVASNSNAPPS